MTLPAPSSLQLHSHVSDLPSAINPGRVGRGILLANVVAEVGIVVSGGLVRLTGSGLGCPTWPECTDGSFVPVASQSQGLHKFIEFGNRMLTFVVLVVAVAALFTVARPALARRFGDSRWLGTRLRTGLGTPGPVRRSLVWLAAAVLLGIFGQAILGGITVLLDLHPATVAAHFLLSMSMVAAAFLLWRRASEPGDTPVQVIVRPELRIVAVTLVVLAAVVLLLGTIVTGSGPHSGDTAEAVRFGLDPRTISWLHADVVLAFMGLTLAYTLGAHLTKSPVASRISATSPTGAGLLLLAACVTQGFIGYLQFFTGLPVGLVSLHMLGACLVWLATLNVFMSTRTRGSN
ncbi:MAG TPA: COX15/CtaA family protein [Actinomycetes bacterium]|nr:COX15/CtaA family protein [Actinomycetes bacterium]